MTNAANPSAYTPLDPATVRAFITRWAGNTASELAAAQSFVIDLCELLGLTKPHPTAEQDYMFECRALSAKEKTIHTQGPVGVLRGSHEELDAEVLAAYGLPASSITDDILAHLVQLNTQCAEEAQGDVRWLRPVFQNPQKSLQKKEQLADMGHAPDAGVGGEKSLSKIEQPANAPAQPRQPWPSALPVQVRAVADVLARSPAPISLPALEQCFKGRGPWKKGLPTLLQTLEALGRARRVESGGEVLWGG